MPVRSGTIGPDVIDVGRLYRDTGCFTYDPGFTSTANCSSRITYIDGDKGVLLYRGYPIDAAGAEIELHRGLLPAPARRAADQAASSRTFRTHRSRATPWCTSR